MSTSFLEVKLGHRPSSAWQILLQGRKVLEKGVKWKLSRIGSVWLLEDPWIGEIPPFWLQARDCANNNLIWVRQLLNEDDFITRRRSFFMDDSRRKSDGTPFGDFIVNQKLKASPGSLTMMDLLSKRRSTTESPKLEMLAPASLDKKCYSIAVSSAYQLKGSGITHL
ncbi:hypothetical protein AHAS_Ahas11G0092300 [Arachis hypogaea]